MEKERALQLLARVMDIGKSKKHEIVFEYQGKYANIICHNIDKNGLSVNVAEMCLGYVREDNPDAFLDKWEKIIKAEQEGENNGKN